MYTRFNQLIIFFFFLHILNFEIKDKFLNTITINEPFITNKTDLKNPNKNIFILFCEGKSNEINILF